MGRKIQRRDFLNGFAVAIGGALLAPGDEPEYYPPALTGLRGSHAGVFETAHQLRDGDFWKSAGTPANTGEEYDLVIVGGGISGLAAAHYYRKSAGGKARILILENHDDFGGHAKRNEFRIGGRTVLGYGGTFSIESPAPYSAVAKALIEELGIDVGSYNKVVDRNLYRKFGLAPAVFFDKETFGADRLVPNPQPDSISETADHAAASDGWARFMNEAPLSGAAKASIKSLYVDKKDYFPGLTSDQKKAKLARMSYADYLSKIVGAPLEVVKYFQARPHALEGVGIDAFSALDSWGLDLPGFAGLGLDPAPFPGMNYDAIANEEAEKYFFHFPDGNATIARLLVRKLIPAAIPGKTVDGIITARASYARLDEASSGVRIRLNSTVVRVAHHEKGVEAAYVRGGKLYTVRARHAILACWHTMIPYLCPELPAEQKEALAFEVKVPIVYTSVLIRNWKAFQRLGASAIHAPGSYFSGVNLDLPVSMGAYRCSQKPAEPIVVHMMKTPCHPGLRARDQHRAGRAELYTTTFATFEAKIRDQLNRMLGAGGFDAARDIAAITVNRWPHGYAYQYNSLDDKFWLEGGEQPCVRARQPFGKIAIANSDSGAYAYTDAAIDHAFRAVRETLARA